MLGQLLTHLLGDKPHPHPRDKPHFGHHHPGSHFQPATLPDFLETGSTGGIRGVTPGSQLFSAASSALVSTLSI